MTREEFESILEEAYIEGYNTAIEDIQEDILDEDYIDIIDENTYNKHPERRSMNKDAKDAEAIGIPRRVFYNARHVEMKALKDKPGDHDNAQKQTMKEYIKFQKSLTPDQRINIKQKLIELGKKKYEENKERYKKLGKKKGIYKVYDEDTHPRDITTKFSKSGIAKGYGLKKTTDIATHKLKKLYPNTNIKDIKKMNLYGIQNSKAEKIIKPVRDKYEKVFANDDSLYNKYKKYKEGKLKSLKDRIYFNHQDNK